MIAAAPGIHLAAEMAEAAKGGKLLFLGILGKVAASVICIHIPEVPAVASRGASSTI